MVGGILFKTIKSSLGYYAAFRASKDPPPFVGRFEDSAALIGIVIAAFETFAATTLNMPVLEQAPPNRRTRRPQVEQFFAAHRRGRRPNVQSQWRAHRATGERPDFGGAQP